MNNNRLKLKYTAKISGIFLFYSLILLNILLLAGKKIHRIQIHFREFFSHISNFIITSILVAIISLIWLLQGAPFKLIIWLALIAILLNVGIEKFVHTMNTPDMMDAIYGTAGALLTVVTMFVIKTRGLKAIV